MNTGSRYVLKQLGLVIGIIVLSLMTLCVGLIIGYALIGDGKNALSILSLEKWHQIIGKFSGH